MSGLNLANAREIDVPNHRLILLASLALLASVQCHSVAAQTMAPMPSMTHDTPMPGMAHDAPMPPKTAAPAGKPAPSHPAVSPTESASVPGGANAIIQVNEAPVPMADPNRGIPMPGDTMADNDIYYQVLFDRLEYVKAPGGSGLAWDMLAWVGRDLNRLWVKSEGTRLYGNTEDARAEALWGHAFAPFWDWQLGVRQDFGNGPPRTWGAFGVQGLAPYWFDIEATAYLGSSGRAAARVRATYDIRFTQRLLLTPEFEANAYSKADEARGIGSGVSEFKLGLRLRYEIRRQFAPYLGVVWGKKLGNTADFARAAGERTTDKQIVAGVRIWF
ncbi:MULTISPECIES: copper resistance protein B [Cupriavidus]|jgi:copper resistance protein B|nr:MULTISPECIES: copper resistance protein B [Cupriavidus]MCT9016891.1 copper resistance protein B [Cupriavidus gilardii]MCT9052398.1 copper resistance protein B [Cupriavidus gilardii]MCT9056587.1 copper resistance protein B [Cupriavidus gilardii]MCT9074172.1 copper resistance protein B [Cupriavidus gilardii]UDM48948.1 copper resistance protein B [Cupriavidus sp. MP-37]